MNEKKLSKMEYNMKYNKEKTTSFIIRLNNVKEKSLIDFLNNPPNGNRSKTIKEAIYMYIDYLKGEEKYYD